MFVMLYMLILGSSLVATLAILARVRVRNHDHIFIVIVAVEIIPVNALLIFVRLSG